MMMKMTNWPEWPCSLRHSQRPDHLQDRPDCGRGGWFSGCGCCHQGCVWPGDVESEGGRGRVPARGVGKHLGQVQI